MHSCSKIKKALTLAEVLITLGIIGVVAALTMPSLIQEKGEKEAVSRLKKIYSTFNQAYILAVSENGTPDGWDIGTIYDYEGSRNLYEPIAKHLKINKDCGNKEKGCHSGWQRADKIPFHFDSENGVTFQLADGVVAGIFTRYEDCKGNKGNVINVCGDLTVDINGDKKPNIAGRDVFRFYITKTGVIPKGTQQESDVLDLYGCYESGESCTGWVLFNENMDYLHCKDLNWKSKTKCGS